MMYDDYDYWRNVVPPGAPDENDKALFKSLIKGDTVLLLGSTKILLDLATDAYDLCPKWDDPKIQDRDWLSVDTHYDTIIGCGPFNFTKELTEALFPILKRNCNRLILRTFYNPQWKLKYAKHFPEPYEFDPIPTVYADNGHHRFFVWDFIDG